MCRETELDEPAAKSTATTTDGGGSSSGSMATESPRQSILETETEAEAEASSSSDGQIEAEQWPAATAAAASPAPAPGGQHVPQAATASTAPVLRGREAAAVLKASRFHTKVVLRAVEKLDLPSTPLQELRLWHSGPGAAGRGPGGRRRRPPAVARLGSEGRWRGAPWGALYLSTEMQCPLWWQLREAAWVELNSEVLEEPVAATPATAASSSSSSRGANCRPQRRGFGCLSSVEAELVAEVELHTCAALHYLASMAGAPSVSSEAAAAPESSRGPGTAQPGFRFAPPPRGGAGGAGAGETEVAVDGPTLPGGSRAEGAANGVQSSPTAGGGSSDGTARLADALWPFFVRMELAEALLEGEVLRAAQWALRLLGLAEPFGLRRAQEVAVGTLELLAEHGQAAAASPALVASFRRSFASYGDAPVIPRFRARFREAVVRLADAGLLPPEAAGEEAAAPGASPGGAAQPDFAAVGLAPFRSRDTCFLAFRSGLAAAAAPGGGHSAFSPAASGKGESEGPHPASACHLGGSCSSCRCELDVRRRLVAGIEAVAATGGVNEDTRDELLQLVASTPAAQPAGHVARLGPPGALLPASDREASFAGKDGRSAAGITGAKGRQQSPRHAGVEDEQQGDEEDDDNADFGEFQQAAGPGIAPSLLCGVQWCEKHAF